ncbi:hypothetical protein [Gymnodinialimonas ceratoperidinii]|uniref:Uncharacterized protein n=1 Tax=Gymnodinialimonas ceratoperidinii TaxID=2856823 RepID=A0A8F6TUV0_9RHOB|nr:hypothetical protein [Gymnodinialimonas ceratoperidinii]QXT38298.1 hypothetical protein KYE46_10065 [Gymnodinialimonas ceratoperidinii]
MADPNHRETHTRTEYREVDRGGGSGMAFILGAVVVVLAILAFLMFGMDNDGGTADVGDGASTSVDVTVGSDGDGDAAAAADADAGGAEAGAEAVVESE